MMLWPVGSLAVLVTLGAAGYYYSTQSYRGADEEIQFAGTPANLSCHYSGKYSFLQWLASGFKLGPQSVICTDTNFKWTPPRPIAAKGEYTEEFYIQYRKFAESLASEFTVNSVGFVAKDQSDSLLMTCYFPRLQSKYHWYFCKEPWWRLPPLNRTWLSCDHRTFSDCSAFDWLDIVKDGN